MEADKSILEDQIAWHKRGTQGCAFASFLSNNARAQYSIWTRVIESATLNEELIKRVKEIFNEACENENTQALSLIIPAIKTENDLKQFIALLYKFYEGVSIDCEYQLHPNYTLVRIRLPLTNEPTRISWMLGFINIDISPLTRRAPFTEIVLPTKSKQYLHKKYNRHSLFKPNSDSILRNEDENSVHLADMQIDGITEITKKDNKLWDASSEMKKAKLEGRMDDRAKGKVTFTISGEFYPVLEKK